MICCYRKKEGSPSTKGSKDSKLVCWRNNRNYKNEVGIWQQRRKDNRVKSVKSKVYPVRNIGDH